MIERILAVIGAIVVLIIALVLIFHLVRKYTPFLDDICKVCKKKRKLFYGVWETKAVYDKKLQGNKIGDEILKGSDNVCTDCCKKYKLFDNI